MADVFSKEKRSEIMSRIGSKNTKPEIALFKIAKEVFYKNGVRYRKHPAHVFGKPDLIIPKHKIAVFADSEFWHGKNFKAWKNRLPKKYWREKIRKNILRDKRVNKILKNQGWIVIRIWSTDLLENKDKTREMMEKKLTA